MILKLYQNRKDTLLREKQRLVDKLSKLHRERGSYSKRSWKSIKGHLEARIGEKEWKIELIEGEIEKILDTLRRWEHRPTEEEIMEEETKLKETLKIYQKKIDSLLKNQKELDSLLEKRLKILDRVYDKKCSDSDYITKRLILKMEENKKKIKSIQKEIDRILDTLGRMESGTNIER